MQGIDNDVGWDSVYTLNHIVALLWFKLVYSESVDLTCSAFDFEEFCIKDINT